MLFYITVLWFGIKTLYKCILRLYLNNPYAIFNRFLSSCMHASIFIVPQNHTRIICRFSARVCHSDFNCNSIAPDRTFYMRMYASNDVNNKNDTNQPYLIIVLFESYAEKSALFEYFTLCNKLHAWMKERESNTFHVSIERKRERAYLMHALRHF